MLLLQAACRALQVTVVALRNQVGQQPSAWSISP
jgi:hypothetical protein